MGNCHSDEMHGPPPSVLKQGRLARRNTFRLKVTSFDEATEECHEAASQVNTLYSSFSDDEEGSAPLLRSKNNVFKVQKDLWNSDKHWNEETDSRVDLTLSMSMDDALSHERESAGNEKEIVSDSETDDEEEEAYIFLRPDSETASTVTFVSNDSVKTEGTKNSVVTTSSDKLCRPPSIRRTTGLDPSQPQHIHQGQDTAYQATLVEGLRMDDVLFSLQAAIKTCKEEIHEDLSPTQDLI